MLNGHEVGHSSEWAGRCAHSQTCYGGAQHPHRIVKGSAGAEPPNCKIVVEGETFNSAGSQGEARDCYSRGNSGSRKCSGGLHNTFWRVVWSTNQPLTRPYYEEVGKIGTRAATILWWGKRDNTYSCPHIEPCEATGGQGIQGVGRCSSVQRGNVEGALEPLVRWGLLDHGLHWRKAG